ncbi:MAG: protein kinase [Acidobacteriia bacterium]|nr:protein kinase [Terriglobia bacterium]
MRCSHCGAENPAGAEKCVQCAKGIGVGSTDDAVTLEITASQSATVEMETAELQGESDWSQARVQPSSDSAARVQLRPGTVLGNRYEIIRSLGKGGMGAVYLARDREVDRSVALKMIRPELADDPAVLRRFRQELVLARQITHSNVVRIFDLGIISGQRFISMEYIEGRQLSSILDERGKLPPKEAAGIMLQICRGLHAAHAEGVVHRDLKPPNIMIEAEGRVVVMDFGIARSGVPAPGAREEPSGAIVESAGSMTQVGTLLGTPIYMSPEQAKGGEVDARSDLFTIGIIFYEMLTASVPFLGESLPETLRKRCEEAAVPPAALDPNIPKALNRIVLKCLETAPGNRYQTTAEMVRELEAYLGLARPAVRRWKWAAGSLAATLLVSGTVALYERKAAEDAKPHAPLKILIADLENQTPDSTFNGALEPLLSFAMEGTSFITSYDRSAAHAVGAELKRGATRLDPSLARLVALREGVNVVISGAISLVNGRYRVSLQAQDTAQGTEIKSSSITAGNRDEVLRSIGKLAAPIRTALGDASTGSAKLAAGETFSAASLEAAQQYAQAQQAQQKGDWNEAVRLYQETVQLDPNSGRAYAGLASTLKNLGRRQEAQKYYEIALTKLDRMSDREKYRTRGGYFLFMGKDQQALEQFQALVTAYPSDTAGLTNLAYAHFLQRDMATAMRLSRQAVDIYPQNVLMLSNAGLFAMYGGDFDEAIRESREILKINPKFTKAFLCIALAQLGQGKPDDTRMTWQQLAGLGKEGASSAALGLADLALYEGRFRDAIGLLPAAIAADLADQNTSEAALKRIALAQAFLAAGEKAKAVAAVEAALRDRTDEPVAFPAAQILLDAGEERQALEVAAKMKSSFDSQPRAYAGVLDGLVKLRHKDYQEAVSALQAARKLSDTWLGRQVLALAYVEAGAFPEAESEADNCVQRRGEATAVFFDDEPSLRYLPAAYYYRGRAREGLHVASAAADFRTFLQTKAQSQSDPMVTDAKRRLIRQ